jgi:hypothetical protein
MMCGHERTAGGADDDHDGDDDRPQNALTPRAAGAGAGRMFEDHHRHYRTQSRTVASSGSYAAMALTLSRAILVVDA